MRAPRLRSPLAQAVGPVLAGIAVLGAIGLALWGFSAWVSGNPSIEKRLGARFFDAGPATRVAAQVAKGGAILYPGLVGDAGDRPIGIAHVGDDPLKGWRVFSLVPPGAPATCILALDRETRELTAPCASARYPEDGTGLDLLPVTKVTIDPDRHLVIDLSPT